MNEGLMDWTIWLRQQRHRAVRIQLGTILVLGFLGVAASLWRWWSGFGYTFTLPIYVVAYIVVILLAILPSVRDEWRARGFIVILYGFGVFSLYSGWLAGGGRQFLLALTVVATVLTTPRAGMATAVASLITYAVFALAFNQKWLILRDLPDPVSLSPMVVEGIGFAMTIGMAATSQWFFGKALQAANEANREALQARTSLAERAQELETANRLLSASTASFHNIVERSADGILIIDRQEVVRFANHAAGSFFDRPADQWIGSSAPFSLTAAQNTAFEILGTGASSQVVEVRVVETEWEGQPAHLAMLRDITRRRRAEEALRASEQKFRSFIEQSSEGFTLVDEKGTVVEWNQAQEQISGLSHTHAIGMTLWDIQSEMAVPEHRRLENIGRIKGMILDILRSGQVPPYLMTTEIEICQPDGQHVFVQQSVFPIAAQKGYRLGSITRDITGRRRTEQALRASEARFRALTENANDMILILDAEGVIQYASPSVQRVMGYAPEELTDQSVFTLLHPDDAAQMRAAWPYLLQQLAAHAETTLTRVRHADGAWHIHEGIGRNLLHEPAIGGIVLNTRDVTARVRQENERETLIAELEAKNAELERFTYTVSHDLKSPLITIKGFLGFLAQDVARGDADRLDHDIKTISNAADKMQQLLDELLELSRIGRLVNPPQHVPMSESAHEAAEMVAGQLLTRGVQVDIAPDMPIVYGDRPRLLEVWQNLLSNATKFMGDQSHPRIEVGARQEIGETVFYVRDNGIGIEPQYQDKVFGLFEKLDSTTEGTGIGLAIVKRIVETHGGRVWVESEGTGHGSMFCFTLAFS